MTDATARPTAGIGRFVKEPFPGLSHAVGAIVAAVGVVCLLGAARSDAATVTGVAVYGVSLVALYVASCLAHSIYADARTNDLLDRLDYAAIFLLIAGTYTPICLTTLHGPWGWWMLGVQWATALVGATMVMRVGPRKKWVALYVPMGWAVVVVAGQLAARMESAALLCLIAGGAVYTIGAAVFLTQRPRLWPGRFGSHDLWHVLVLLGSGLHFATVWCITTA
jgi:hemolysin III